MTRASPESADSAIEKYRAKYVKAIARYEAKLMRQNAERERGHDLGAEYIMSGAPSPLVLEQWKDIVASLSDGVDLLERIDEELGRKDVAQFVANGAGRNKKSSQFREGFIRGAVKQWLVIREQEDRMMG